MGVLAGIPCVMAAMHAQGHRSGSRYLFVAFHPQKQRLSAWYDRMTKSVPPSDGLAGEEAAYLTDTSVVMF